MPGSQQGVVHLDLRPIRLAYLLRQGSRADVRSAMLEACTRWGGMQELMIPVRRSGEVDNLWRGFLDTFPVDYLCAVGDIPRRALDAFGSAYQIDVVTLEQVQTNWFGLHPLAALPPEDARGLNSVYARADDPLPSIAALGAFRTDQDRDAWLAAGATIAMGPQPLQAAGMQLAGRTLIGATTHQCGEARVEGWPAEQIVIWLANRASLTDVILFWNFRALLPVVLQPRPICLVDPETAGDPQFRQILQSAANAMPIPTTPPALMYSWGILPPQRAAVARAMGVPIFRGRMVTRHLDIRQRSRMAPLSVSVQAYPRTGGKREPGVRSSVLTLVDPQETIVRAPTPVRWGAIGGSVRARFSGPTQFKIPQSRSAARLFHDAAVAYQGMVEIQTETAPMYEFRLRVPEGGSIIRAALGDLGASLQLSDKGRLAAGVRNIASDIRLFRDAKIVATIDALTTHRFKYELKEARKQLPDRGEVELASLVQSLREVRQVTRSSEQARSEMAGAGVAVGGQEMGELLTRLVEARLAARGLSVRCDVCGFPSFVPLADVVVPMSCPACGSLCGFVIDPQRREPLMHYRLNAMLDRASDQGVMLHLSAAALLEEVEPSTFAPARCEPQFGWRDEAN